LATFNAQALRQPTTNKLQIKQKIAQTFTTIKEKGGKLHKKKNKAVAQRKSRDERKTVVRTRSLKHAGMREKRLLPIPITVRHGRRNPNFFKLGIWGMVETLTLGVVCVCCCCWCRKLTQFDL